jgi:hypothetical protein
MQNKTNLQRHLTYLVRFPGFQETLQRNSGNLRRKSGKRKEEFRGTEVEFGGNRRIPYRPQECGLQLESAAQPDLLTAREVGEFSWRATVSRH